MVEVTADTEEFLASINVLAEINIVDLINVTLVHVTTENFLGDGVRGGNAERVNHAQELLLSDVAVLGAVEILEDRLQHDATHLDGVAVLVHNRLEINASSA